jgi:GNAT superfamily N-acetyltransferase
VAGGSETCVVLLLGYPGVGKRTVGSHLTELLDAVLVDNQLINIPLLTLFKWDGKFLLPTEIWDRVGPIREAVLGTIEDLAPKSNSYVFTNVLKDDEDGVIQYSRIRSLAQRRGSLFLSVLLSCEVDEQVRRIAAPDRIARLKGSDPEGYRRYRDHTKLFQPPPGEVVQIDTTTIGARQNAETIHEILLRRGLQLRSRAVPARRPTDEAMAGGVQYAWRAPLTDAEMVDLVESHGGRSAVGWWDRVRHYSLGWVTARTEDGVLVGFANVAWDGGDHAFLLDPKTRSTRQHEGIGTAVVALAVKHARAAGCEWLHVDFDPELAPFYLGACGFERTDAGLIHLVSE